jgi:hypothetical protein
VTILEQKEEEKEEKVKAAVSYETRYQASHRRLQ